MILSPSDIRQFVEDGFIIVREAFPRAVAAEARHFVWREVERSWRHCSTKGQPMIHLKRNFACTPFDRVMNPSLGSASDQLVGAERTTGYETYGYDWWPILLPGFPGPSGWHIDDFAGPKLRLRSPLKTIVPLFLFSDIEPNGGGRPMIRGSHRDVVTALSSSEPNGLETNASVLAALKLDLPGDRLVSVVGRAGEVALMHPFLIHGFGPNKTDTMRFACNPLYALKGPLNLAGRGSDLSPVELAVVEALR
jgi:hypothetical protein